MKEEDSESTSSKSSIRSARGKRSAVSIESDGEPEHPLRTLVKAAKLMNPIQFDVGKEIACNKPLPGEISSTQRCFSLFHYFLLLLYLKLQ